MCVKGEVEVCVNDVSIMLHFVSATHGLSAPRSLNLTTTVLNSGHSNQRPQPKGLHYDHPRLALTAALNGLHNNSAVQRYAISNC